VIEKGDGVTSDADKPVEIVKEGGPNGLKVEKKKEERKEVIEDEKFSSVIMGPPGSTNEKVYGMMPPLGTSRVV